MYIYYDIYTCISLDTFRKQFDACFRHTIININVRECNFGYNKVVQRS